MRARVDQHPVAFGLLPPTFTLSELQSVYELLLGRRLHKASFRRSLHASSLVEATDEMAQRGTRTARSALPLRAAAPKATAARNPFRLVWLELGSRRRRVSRPAVALRSRAGHERSRHCRRRFDTAQRTPANGRLRPPRQSRPERVRRVALLARVARHRLACERIHVCRSMLIATYPPPGSSRR